MRLRACGIESVLLPWKQLLGDEPAVERALEGFTRRGMPHARLLPGRLPGMPTAQYKRLLREAAVLPNGLDGRPVIVIADDDRDMLELFKMLLGNDFTLRTAVNGAEAVELCRAHMPDLIMLNGMMPVMDGVSACRRLREIPAFKGTRIIIHSSSSIKGLALDAGANGFISTPCEPKTLRDSAVQAVSIW